MTIQSKIAKSHDDILEELAAALDIPPALFEDAVNRYKSLGAWLDRQESTIARYSPTISPQGSFLIGTVIRPLTDADEYDVDLVCLLNATKLDFTQKELKEAVGHEVKSYANARNMKFPAEEGRRCWTLHYADGARFHMDVLPALPDEQRYRQLLERQGFESLANDSALTNEAIAITDKTLPQYSQTTDEWPQSNPQGFAAWFKLRMQVQLLKRKQALAEKELLVASVDQIPDYRIKTPLQRALQLLKRHRDSMFQGVSEHQPISVIITTLSAWAYNNEESISTALHSILTRMDSFIENRNGVLWVANPVNPNENFADKWAETPEKKDNFFAWLTQARRDFSTYLRASTFDAIPEALQEKLGQRLSASVLASLLPTDSLAAPAIIRERGASEITRAEAAIERVQHKGAASKPWGNS